MRVNNLLYHLNITSEVKQYYEAMFLSYRPLAECSFSLFCNTKCTHSIFRTIDRSTRGLLAVTLQHNKELIMVIFHLMVLSMCNLQKLLMRAAFWVFLQAMFTERLRTNGTTIKIITRETTENQWKKYNWVKHMQRQQFSFSKTSIKVSLKILILQA